MHVCRRCSLIRPSPRAAARPAALCVACSNGYPWSFSKCDFDDFNGWADAADAELVKRGMDLSKWKYK